MSKPIKKCSVLARLLLSSFALTLGVVSSASAAPGVVTNIAFPVLGTVNPGNLSMWEYVPNLPVPVSAPLVVVLPGCGQLAVDYAEQSGWKKLADDKRFYLVIAEQKTVNDAQRCFRWWDANHNRRGFGEAYSIQQMIEAFIRIHGAASVDRSRVFVSGLSAGGAMAAAMLATYPDVFKGGAINAGVPYGCTQTASANACMLGATLPKTSAQWGKLAKDAYPVAGGWTGRKPIVALFHGSADAVVTPGRMTELRQQWTNYNNLRETATTTWLKGYPRQLFNLNAASGLASSTPVQTVSVTGMTHGVAIQQGTLADQCGRVAPFVNNTNLCSTYYSTVLWGL